MTALSREHHRGITCDVEEPRVAASALCGTLDSFVAPFEMGSLAKALWITLESFATALLHFVQLCRANIRGISCDVEEPRVALGSHAASAFCGTLDSSVAKHHRGISCDVEEPRVALGHAAKRRCIAMCSSFASQCFCSYRI